jgi:8-amino-7-oxononanoate synthase
LSGDRAIAIVGAACRYGGAPDLAGFWSQTLERRDGFRPLGDARWRSEAFRPAGRKPNTTPTERTAWLDDVGSFAVRWFGMSPLRAEAMDPQQRLTLETSREALIDAGLETRPWARDRSAVFVGATVSEYSRIMVSGVRARQMASGEYGREGAEAEAQAAAIAPIRAYTIAGSQLSMAASVVAQAFDLRGPSIAVDGACASSLVTAAMAAKYLRDLGPTAADAPSPVALAGGVYVNLLPDNLVGFSRIGVLARHACRPFDAAAEGFLLGEGVGVVVLKRLADAVRDGDRIYAVIAGLAQGSDGAAESPMTPTSRGQQAVLRAALHDAGSDGSTTGYVECHGTATATGDALELASLDQVLPPREAPYVIGSVKANIGHTLSAAGVAGLLRACLAIHHGMVPPQAGFAAWHPALARYAARFHIPRDPRPWSGVRRQAIVASFGFGGINCALVLEEAPPARRGGEELEVPFVISAPTPTLLHQHIDALERAIDDDVAGAGWTLTATRHLHEHVLAFRARGLRDVREAFERARGGGTQVADFYLGPREAMPDSFRADPAPLFPPAARRILSLPAAPLERELCWGVGSAVGRPDPPAATLKEVVAQAIREVTGTPAAKIEPGHRLDADLGFDSLLAAELALRLAERSGVALPLAAFSERPTVERLVSRLRAAIREPREWIVPPEAVPPDGVMTSGAILDYLAWSAGARAPFQLTAAAIRRRPRVRGAVRIVASGAALRDSRGRLVASATLEGPGAEPEGEVVKEGTVEATRPPGGAIRARSAWHLDPGVVDATLALVASDALLHRVEAVVLRRPFTPGPVTVRVQRRPDGRLDGVWRQGDAVVGWLSAIKIRSRRRSRSGPLAAIPELRSLEHRLRTSPRNPYFASSPQALSFVRYDYLALNGHPTVSDAACEAIRRSGTSASASRLVGGELPEHRALETGLAAFLGCEDAVAMVSGHATNVTTIGRLVGPGDLILYDALVHDSVQQGAVAARAARRAFPHNDVDALERILARARSGFRRVLIVSEGLFSMHGDICPLPALSALRERHDALLMIDEAHSLGVLGARGRGVAEHWGLGADSADVWMGTLSKTLASCGGYIAGSDRLVRYLKYSAPGFVYSVGMPPSQAAAARAALSVLEREPERVERLRERARFLRRRLRLRGLSPLGAEDVPIVPLMVGDSDRCLEHSAAIGEQGVAVMPIVYPAVPREEALLRLFVTCAHSLDDLERAADTLAEALGASPVLV